ncbi:MAG: DUF2752 domain-containing protein [Deltaproteobacteria bacterium]|nr:DUF2752 domain-containing protein [Deltaproteobacteria bacterium]
MLLTAAWLVPDPRGLGTDTQLGLGTCTFLAMTGYPCPMCGATTTFTLLAHLRPLDGLINQPFAASLFVLTLALFGVAWAEVLQPRGRWGKLADWLSPYESSLASLFLAAMGAGWIYKIALMRWLP